MHELEDGRPVEHVGDGVYAVHNGHSIELRVNHHLNPTVVHLEISGLEALQRFHERVSETHTQNDQ